MKRPTSFDFELEYEGHSFRVVGTVDPGEPATGPTYDCGGTPGCGPCVENLSIELIRKRKDGTVKKRDLGEASSKLMEALEPFILERLDNEQEDW